ncbi:MAG: folate family ECF transporter S component [Ezakiella sp.]|nr:folate family ECF transporter S component [Ezakiella sp.]MDD7471625.1 folate family ECF transporter S component [Bacillota bacterium]MDY3923409.1 folate family ECF transporter S component [Ezakiella sp.]
MKNKKLWYDISWANIVTTLVLSTFVFYSIYNIKNASITLPIMAALCLVTLCGALNGTALGGITSSLSLLGGIIYKVKYTDFPTFNATKKMIEKFGETTAEQMAANKAKDFALAMENLYDAKIFIFLGALILAFIGRKIWLYAKAKKASKKGMRTAMLSYLAMFVALSVILNTLRVGHISFGGFPIIYSGFALGPVAGFIVGVVSDLLGFLVRPSANAFNLAFTLTSGLTGMIPALVLKLFGKDKANKNNFLKVLLAIFIGQLITSILLVPYFMKIFYGYVFWERVLKALTQQVWSIPLYSFVFISTWNVINKQVDFNLVKQDNDFAFPAK